MPARTDERILNRELSWLDFNHRVLALADDPNVPLLERVKFCAIFSSNLDEFFQVRVAALKDQVAAQITKLSPDGRTPAHQLIEISDLVSTLIGEQEAVFLGRLVPSLREAGISLCSWDELEDHERKQLVEVFERRIFPVLTPLAVDPAHPFPYISNLSLNLAVMVTDPESGERRFARVKVPSLLPRFLPLPDGHKFVPLEQVIASQLPTLFSGMELEEHWAFRVTRNADLTVEEEEADDLLAAVEMELRRRRFGRAVRLEVAHGMSAEVLGLLQRELDISDDDVFRHHGPLDLRGLFGVAALDRSDLKDEPWPAVTKRRLESAAEEQKSIFSVVREGPVLVHHPYDSFATSTEEFIRQASEDPRVLTIKITLYRTSGDSPIIRSLIRAAERGVQVAALVELKARFDEQANIAWAKALERAGVHVVYGIVGLKTHSKCVLVVREEGDGIRRYLHIGTGNYNSSTARLYEDLGLLTCDTDLGTDLTQLFNHLTGYSREVRYSKLLVAPRWMRHRFQDLIANEASFGERGRIIMKMNSLVDPVMVESLYEASQAGVEIDLIIRGICCLRPGVAGLSEHIRARSIVGRYLEHSRIYHFANGRGPGAPLYLIGSADLMPRNLDRRVEVIVPIEAPEHQAALAELLDVNLADDVLAWRLLPDSSWERVLGGAGIDTQRRLYDMACRSRRYSGSP
jgi:polyphosphate kinase